MYRFLFTMLCALALVSAIGQYKIGVYSGFAFYPSTGYDRMMSGGDGSSYDRFAASYNALNASDLSKPLSPFKMIPGMHAGMNMVTKAFYMECAYNTVHGRSTAEFASGTKRVLDMKCKDFDIGIGLGVARPKFYVFLVGVMFFGFGDRLDAWTEYPDGTKSFGSENYLNGHYEALRLGIRPGLRFGYSLTNRWTIMLSFDKLKEGGEHDEYRDDLAGDIGTELIITDPENIGVEWGEYINNTSDYILNDKELVKSGWNGLQIRPGVCFNISYSE